MILKRAFVRPVPPVTLNLYKYFELHDGNDIIFACIFATGGFSDAVETRELCYGATLRFPYGHAMSDSGKTIYFTPKKGGRAFRTVIFNEGKVKSL